MIKKGFQKQNKTGPGILICGAYGQGNAGDEAILDAIAGSLNAAIPDARIAVLTRDPEGTARRLGVLGVYSFNVLGFLKAARQSDLFISGGGSLIQDVTSRRSLWYYLFTIAAARLSGCRVLMYGCGIGPVHYRWDQKLTRLVLNRFVDAITLREEHSRRELARFGVHRPEIILSADPAITLPAAEDARIDALMVQNGLTPGGKYLCLALRDWDGFTGKAACFAAAADRAFDKYGLTTVFLSINSRDDGAAAQLVRGKMRSPSILLAEPFDSALTIGLISRMTAMVSMRLHGLIFAAGQGIPLVAVSYDPKVTAFMDYIGQSRYAGLEGISDAALFDLIDSAMAASGQNSRLAEKTAELGAKEKRNIDAAIRLIRSRER